MRLRTVALALTLACGLAAVAEARHKPAAQFRKPRKVKPRKYKAPKIKRGKSA